MVVCKRCGTCCHYEYNGRIKPCKHLIKLSSGKYLCRIYNKRLGTVIDKLPNGDYVVCKNRLDKKQHYKDCPYNEKIRI